jgi:hypothetical protein
MAYTPQFLLTCDGEHRAHRMPLSQKTKNRLLMPFAISPIMKWCGFPGIIGMLMIVFGSVWKIGWLKVAGFVLAAPIFWVYFVVIFIFTPFLIFDKIRRCISRFL